MKFFKRAISLIVISTLVLGAVPGLAPAVFAAPLPIHIQVESYQSSTLTISWRETVPEADTICLVYHIPGADNEPVEKKEFLPLGSSTATISGLKNNFIYDIRIEMYSGVTLVGEGLLYFTPGISFTATPVKEYVSDVPPDYQPPYDPAGGREIGTKPRLNLKWNIPRVYIEDGGGRFEYVSNPASLSYMQNQINSIYNEGRVLSRLNYRINISTDANDMTLNDAVIVDGMSNQAYVSGYEEQKANVVISEDTVSLDLLGRASPAAAVPETSGSTLGHREIYPGTIYYMTLQLVIDSYPDAVVMHGSSSPLQGKPYTYTFIRFQLSKDDLNNVYAKVYTVNQGSLALPDLYYEVQTNTADSEYGWETKAMLDPEYFRDASGNLLEFGIIPIIGVSPNNNLYYRIVVTSGGSDVIKSQNLPYRMTLDTSRPPIPRRVAIGQRVLVTKEVDGKVKKSTDVTISWDKPLNWDEIKNNTDPANDIYFCFMLSTGQTEITEPPFPALEEEDGTVYPDFPVKYRLVRYINARTALLSSGTERIVENGNRLEYTLKGFELFKWVDQDGVLQDFPVGLPDELKPEDGYPRHLLSNTVYYLQMFTIKGPPENMISSSERSVTVSFTTKPASGKEVPLPNNFMLVQPDGNQVDVVDGKVINTVKLQFDAISNINWSDYDSPPEDPADNRIYYDLYMGTSTSSFVLIGSTDPNLEDQNNVDFQFVGDARYTYVVATISRFTKGDALSVFGSGLTPNTTYYFKVRTRLEMPGSIPDRMESEDTHLLPVTTLKGPMIPPDDSQRTPVAPTDFAIAKDKDGNLLLTATSVVFEWLRQESDVTYTLICTSARVPMNADPDVYINDPVYQEFRSAYGITGNAVGIVLDPSSPPGNFEYDNALKICRFKVDRFLFPNRLYYFSIRAERSSGKKSAWISIPVTTLLIESPLSLAPVNNAELGFYFTDPDINMKPEDYAVYVKGPNDKDYKLMPRARLTVTRDSQTIYINGVLHYVYYARVYNLEKNAAYSILVYRGSREGGTLIYQQSGVYTRDAVHETEVKWRGKAGYEYEIAIKPADATDYITLSPANMQAYMAVDGRSYPYYIEENSQTAGTDECWFYARIKTVPVTLSDGRVENRPLRSNTKYSIKVRAVKKDPTGHVPTAYSKYAGPVETRTDFDQDEYDRDEDNKENRIEFMERIKALDESIFWRIAIGNGTDNKVLLKGDRAVNFIRNAGRNQLILDISLYAKDLDSDVIYIPADVIKTLNSENQSLLIRTSGAEFTFRPETLDMEQMPEVSAVKGRSGVKDLFFKLQVRRSEKPQPAAPSGTHALSAVNGFRVQLYGSSRTDAELRELIRNKLYNEATGLVSQKLNIIADLYETGGSGSQGSSKAIIEDMVEDVENELSYYIRDIMEGAWGTSGMLITSESIKTFGKPLLVKLIYKQQKGMKVPYAYYDGSSSWQKAAALSDSAGAMTFDAAKPGIYAIFGVETSAAGVPENHWAKASIEKLMAKYDLSDVFAGINRSVNPSAGVSVKEVILLYEKITGKTDENAGFDIRKKAGRLGLDSIISLSNVMKDVTRQEMAGVLVKMYAQRTGADIGSLKPGRTVNINDERKIEDKFYRYVVLVVDLGIMTLDSNGNFAPAATMDRAGVITAVVRLLELTGDI